MCVCVCVCVCVQALLMRGEVLEGLKCYKDASDTYRRALAIHPGNRELEEAQERVQATLSKGHT